MKTALIIIDIQNDYFDKETMTLSGSDKASENAKLILDRFRADSLPIIHIQHIAANPAATFFLPGYTGRGNPQKCKTIRTRKSNH